MKRVALVSLILILTGVVPLSCNLFCLNSGGCCGDFNVKDFNILAFGVTTVDEHYVKTDTINFKSFDKVKKEIAIKEMEFVALDQTSPSRTLFVQTANACSPPLSMAIQNFKHINIVSRVNASIANSADLILDGQDITDRFLMGRKYSAHNLPIDTFITESGIIYEGDSFIFTFQLKPFQPTVLRFDVVITMTDGQVFEFKNEVLKIN